MNFPNYYMGLLMHIDLDFLHFHHKSQEQEQHLPQLLQVPVYQIQDVKHQIIHINGIYLIFQNLKQQLPEQLQQF